MRWRRYLERKRREEDFAREIESYLTHEIDENVARGMNPDQAFHAAQRKFGNTTYAQEAIRKMSTLQFVESFWQNLRYGLRQLHGNPGFTITAILSLALGIGANTAVFQLLSAIRLRSLPVKNPQELAEVKIAGGNRGWGLNPSWIGEATYPLWEQIRDHQQAFSEIFAWGVEESRLGEAAQTRSIRGLWASGAIFSTLGVTPYRGRLFMEADDRPGCGMSAVVISYGFWQREFGGQDSAIGAKLTIDGRPVTVTGVTPPEFFGLEVGKGFDMAAPTCALGVYGKRLDRRDLWWLGVIGRLKPDWPLPRAAEHLRTISPGLFEAVAPTGYDAGSMHTWYKFRLTAEPAGSGVSRLRREYETSLLLLLGITGLVLLIACANLANLLLARAAAREREMAVRLAIGASRGRLISQGLSESLLLAGVGAVIGAGLAGVLSKSLVWFLSTEREAFQLDLNLDWRVLVFTAAIAMLTCILFGLAPALRSTRTDAASAIKSGGRGSTVDRNRFSFQHLLIVSQITVSLVLVVGALLFVRSFWKLTTLDAGFRQEGIVFTFLDFSPLRVPAERIQPLKEQLLEKVRSIPGIESASTSTHVPLSGSSWTLGIRVPGFEGEGKGWSRFTWVSPRYFSTMEIPVLAGRDFNGRDTATSPKVLLVNQTFVRRIFGTANPIGKAVRSLAEPGYPETVYEIIGVVKDTKYSALREEIQPIAFVPDSQHTSQELWTAIVTRSSVPPANVVAAMRQAIAEGNPQIRMNFEVLRTMVNDRLVRERVLAWLSGFFGGLSALLAMIGLYGVISYTVARRQNEIGIRLALGASRPRVVRLVLGQLAALLLIGISLGTLISVVAARGARTLLFGIEPHDPVTLALSAATLASIAILASLIPAWRASRLDPLAALRQE